MSGSVGDRTARPVVIGGGVAGIAAAVRLAEAGRAPLLLESRPFLGGRTRSFIHEPTGDEIDNGQHLMMGCYEATFALLEKIGTRHLVALQTSLEVEFREPGGRTARLASPTFLPSPLDALVGMLRLEGLSLGERIALARVAVAARLGRVHDQETVRAYLTRHGQSLRAQTRLWDPIVIATLNTAPDVASAHLFVEVMRRAFLGGGDASKLALPRAGLSRLLEPAREYIEARGGRVSTGAQVTGIASEGDGFRIEVKDREPVAASRVVLAIPPGALRTLMARGGARPVETGIAERIAPSPIVSTYLWYDRDPAGIPMFAALLGSATQWMFNRRAISGAGNERFPGLLSCTISAAAAEAASGGDDLVRLADADLRAAFPELREARLLEGIAIKEKLATFLATPDVDRLRPAARGAVPGIFLAGDWTDTGLPATIEGAAASGDRAADLVLRS